MSASSVGSRGLQATNRIAAASSAVPTPGSLWAPTRPRSSASGRRSAARSSWEDLSGNLIVQLGLVTEPLNRHWYERNTGKAIKDVRRRVKHPVVRWMAATLDGVVDGTGAVFEAKFMLPWSFSEEVAAEKHMAQLQHNMWVVNTKTAVLSIITGGGKWVEITIPADCSTSTSCSPRRRSSGAASRAGSPLASSASSRRGHASRAVRIVDMSSSNAWAELAAVFRSTREAFAEHEKAKAELKGLMPEDAKEADRPRDSRQDARSPAR